MILRVCVVVPTYNNPETISDVLKDIVLHTPFPVLVIDDGSNTPVADRLYSWDVRNAMEAGRVRVIRREKNLGKGSALQLAIRDLSSQGFTHMLTIDGDGQHKAVEAMKLAGLAKAHPWDLIIGNRHMKGSVPSISRFGRKFSNFWVTYQTGLSVQDSQSGLRLYPLFPIQNYSFFTKRYDFEIEVLIRMVWNGVHVREVETDVYYFPADVRVTHFHKLWDNVRLTILNAVLVVISLMKSHTSPARLGVSAGLGVFIGCTPFFGLHALMAVGASAVLRLNVVAMLIGSNISAPPLVPFLLLGSVYAGSQWLGVELSEGILPHFYQWLAGSVILGSGLGLLFGLLTFAGAWLVQHKRKRRINWSGRRRGGRFGNGVMVEVLRYAGLKTGYACLLFIVPYFYWFAPKARRGLHEYYRILQPEGGYFSRVKKIHRHFYRFGQVLMDKAFQSFHSEAQFTAVSKGLENFAKEAGSENGSIVLGAHMGGWDLSAQLMQAQGIGVSVHRIEYRADHGDNQDTIFDIHQALSLGQCVGLMGDRPLSDRFELIPFLGKLAPFDVTAFRMAAAAQVPLLFAFGFKGEGTEYRYFGKSARVYRYAPQFPRELQLYAWAEQYVREIETLVRQYPDQWFNFYPFWSAVPTAPDGKPVRTVGNCLLEELPLPAEWEAGVAVSEARNSQPQI